MRAFAVAVLVCAAVAWAAPAPPADVVPGMRWPDPEAVQAVDASLPLVASVFGDHMVLQRGGKGPIVWGFVATGTTVSVSFAGKDYSAAGDATGTWRVQLAPLAAGGPYTLTVTSGASTTVLSDILIGDVFIVGGQSNAQFTVDSAFNASEEIVAADNYPNIRVMTVGQGTTSTTPLVNLATIEQTWAVASKSSIGVGNWSAFSAIGWFFARDIYNGLGGDAVPLGLISDNWGGTRIELWTPAEYVSKCNDTPAGNLWNAMINPLQVGPLALTGAIWYQGEANVGSSTIYPYACVFPAMVTAWRAAFASNFWFAGVQLAPYNISGYAWANLRLAQESVLSLDNTALATAMDLGDALSPFGNVHPRYKQTVGARLAANALAEVYGKSVPHLSPIATGAVGSTSGTTITVTVSFDPASVVDGLQLLPGNKCPTDERIPANICAGFLIQVEGTGELLEATAAIGNSNTVVITATAPAENLKPAAVLSSYIAWPIVTLYSGAGFPAFPFNLPVQAQ